MVFPQTKLIILCIKIAYLPIYVTENPFGVSSWEVYFCLRFWDYLFAGFEDQFQTYSVQNFGYEYDLYSLMHYRLTEFSRNGLHTIESKSNPNDRLGNNEFFTKIDLKQINSLYNCPSKYLKCKLDCLWLGIVLYTF